MKKLLLALVLLAITSTPVLAYAPEGDGNSAAERLGPPSGYKGSWYIIKGISVKQEDLVILGPSPSVAKETNEVLTATRTAFFPDGNYTCFYNDSWDYYMCQPNNGNSMVCKYFDNGNYACIFPEEEI